MSFKKHYFNAVDTKVDFVLLEKEILKNWYERGIVSKFLKRNYTSSKYFSFLDGPITANNPMGIHHAWGRTYKDLWQRFYNMRGFKQRFQNGFDCQGLWVEVEVEKELGLKSKKDIENLVPGNSKASISKFVELCKQRVNNFSSIQTEQSKRLGYFMDWDNSYFTLSDNNNYMIWYFLKKCHELGLIYKGTDVVPWCPRCETAISEHEILTEDYKEISHESIYLKFPIVGEKDIFFLVWTTTPWTVPANIAISVDSEMNYSLAEVNGNKYWLASKLVEKIFGKDTKIIKSVKGRELVGYKYQGAFDDLPNILKISNEKGFHEVVPTDSQIMPISEEEGTGLVHTSTGTGAEDHRLGKKLNLPIASAIEDDARYIDGYGILSGKNAKQSPEIIIEYLNNCQNGKFIYKTEKYFHRYPACWRCKTELVWKLAEEWYIAIDPVREDMKKVTKGIKWLPKFGLKRELDWLNNMHDWLISKKNRYWGLALPIWECKKCGNFDVIGSKEELKERAISGWEKFEKHSPHKPWIDEVKIKCSKCSNIIERIPDVGNPWLDAGIVSFSTISKDNKSNPLYWTDKKEWQNWYPADFLTESFPGQFKNWFYSLIAMSTVLEKKAPSKTILGFATLLAEDGRPMHKSWGNAIEFNEGAEKIGADVMRWIYCRQDPAENLLFGYKIADEVRRKFHLKLWNIYNFFITYANIDGWKPEKKIKNILTNSYKKKSDLSLLDRWIVSKFNILLKRVITSLENYDAYSASIEIENFVDDFSNWYIRRSRERINPLSKSEKDKNSFYATTYIILVNLSKILAPFIPFISESIYKNLTKENSVHLSDWPDYDPDWDDGLISEMAFVREVVEKAHSERKLKNISLRQPLKSLIVTSNINRPASEYINLMKDELNVKGIDWKKGKELKIKFDTRITPELEEEAKARELIRKIQQERKDMGINLTHTVSVTNPWIPKNKEILQKVKIATQAKVISIGEFEVKEYSS